MGRGMRLQRRLSRRPGRRCCCCSWGVWGSRTSLEVSGSLAQNRVAPGLGQRKRSCPGRRRRRQSRRDRLSRRPSRPRYLLHLRLLLRRPLLPIRRPLRRRRPLRAAEDTRFGRDESVLINGEAAHVIAQHETIEELKREKAPLTATACGRLAQPVNANANAAAASTAAASAAAATAHATNAHAAANAHANAHAPPASLRRPARHCGGGGGGGRGRGRWSSDGCVGEPGVLPLVRKEGCRRAIRGQGSEAEKDEGGRSSVGTASSTPQKKSEETWHCGRCVGQVTVEDGPIESPASQQEARRTRGRRATVSPSRPSASKAGSSGRRVAEGGAEAAAEAGAAPLEETAVAVLTTAGEGAVEEQEEEERADKGTSPTPTPTAAPNPAPPLAPMTPAAPPRAS